MSLFTSAESIRKVPVRSVFIEIETDLLADLLGQRFSGANGVVSMEQVFIRYDAGMNIFVAEPVILRQEG